MKSILTILVVGALVWIGISVANKDEVDVPTQETVIESETHTDGAMMDGENMEKEDPDLYSFESEITMDSEALGDDGEHTDDSMMEAETKEEGYFPDISDSPRFEDENINQEEESIVEETVMEKTAGTYVAYADANISELEGDIILDFYAAWCPSCRTLEGDIKENLGNIPVNMTIVKVDYDTEDDLKKKYGVTSQHTLVQVDKDGNLIKKWQGGNTLNSIVAKFSV